MSSLPHELNPVAPDNCALICRLLFTAASRKLLEFGRNPCRLGCKLGITIVLHAWVPSPGQHMHVHCIFTDGDSSPDGQRWIAPLGKGILFSTAAISKVFRGKYLDFLRTAYRDGELRLKPAGGDSREFECLETALRSHDWVVYTKAPFAGAEQVLAHLGRYSHKIAIGNHRLVDFDGQQVRFRWRDEAGSNKVKVMRLDADEFIRRFLLHVLPRGLTRLRHYGLLANRCRARKLALCRGLLHWPVPEPRELETKREMLSPLTGIDITVRAQCGEGILRRIFVLVPQYRTLMPAMKTGPLWRGATAHQSLVTVRPHLPNESTDGANGDRTKQGAFPIAFAPLRVEGNRNQSYLPRSCHSMSIFAGHVLNRPGERNAEGFRLDDPGMKDRRPCNADDRNENCSDHTAAASRPGRARLPQ